MSNIICRSCASYGECKRSVKGTAVKCRNFWEHRPTSDFIPLEPLPDYTPSGKLSANSLVILRRDTKTLKEESCVTLREFASSEKMTVRDAKKLDGSMFYSKPEIKTKISWYRNAKPTGLDAVAEIGSLRGCYGVVGREQYVVFITNSSCSPLHGDSKAEWKVTLSTASGSNITLTKRFPESCLEAAKEWAAQVYENVVLGKVSLGKDFTDNQRVRRYYK